VNHAQTRKLVKALGGVPQVEILTPRFFNEVAVRTPKDAAELIEIAAEAGVLAGVPVSRLAPGAGMDDVLLLAATELTTDGDIARLTETLTGVLA
jgi:glycine dehydrogenase subunit 1